MEIFSRCHIESAQLYAVRKQYSTNISVFLRIGSRSLEIVAMMISSSSMPFKFASRTLSTLKGRILDHRDNRTDCHDM